MSLLPSWELPWLEDLIDEDDHPVPPPELLTLTVGFGWWSESTELPGLDD